MEDVFPNPPPTAPMETESVLRSEERNLPHLNCERGEWERNLSEIDLVVSDRQM